MGSGEFLQALLSTVDSSYTANFSFRTKALLYISQTLFPGYIKRAAISRLQLKKDLEKIVKKYHRTTLIELGSGYSKEYLPLVKNKKVNRLIQIDKENILNSTYKKYQFIKGDITKQKVWNTLGTYNLKRGLIVAEGLFSYLDDAEFNFVVDNLREILKKKVVLLTHEPLRPISFSRKIISLFIGKTYRRFTSPDQIIEYYDSYGMQARILKSTPWQAIYEVKV